MLILCSDVLQPRRKLQMLLECSTSFAEKRCNLDVVWQDGVLVFSHLLILNSQVANVSSNLLSSNDGFRNLAKYRVPTGMENLMTSCLQLSKPLAIMPYCLRTVAAGLLVMFTKMDWSSDASLTHNSPCEECICDRGLVNFPTDAPVLARWSW